MVRRIVIGLGGNALLQRGEKADASVQLGHIADAAPGLAKVASEWELVIVHGNGPQVGMLARKRENDPSLTTTYPLDALVAETQGLLGYWLQQSIANAGLNGPITTIVTQTVVDPNDPAFKAPTKFIGREYTDSDAHRLATNHGWHIARDGDSWRRVVPSPAPVRVVETAIVEAMLGLGMTVICAGGAGCAVVEHDGVLHGVDAVVDKDHVAALLAIALNADRLVILTDVPAVIADYDTPNARPLHDVTANQLAAEQFAAGSMGPKVAAACHYARSTGNIAGIGALDQIADVIAGSAGTHITAEKFHSDTSKAQ
jgi:carbamate kinase